MYLVAIGWMYVVLMMAVVEAMAPQGTVLGAVITFVFYGLLPMGIVLYVMGSPRRKRQRLAAEAAAARDDDAATPGSAQPPDGRGLPAGDAVAPVREER